MAGHSKWANIKYRKERADKKKGKLFTRATKEIISAVKNGGPDPRSNPRLRLAIDKARAINLPQDNIERNIKKAANQDQADYFEMSYEFYGHGGVGLIVDLMTDNRNRAASDMRIATNKKGGSIAMPGAVAFNFERKGILAFLHENTNEEALFLAAIEAGAEDVQKNEEMYLIITDPKHLYQVKDSLYQQGFTAETAQLEMLPKVWIELTEELLQANWELIEWLEDLDDVDGVYHNMQITPQTTAILP